MKDNRNDIWKKNIGHVIRIVGFIIFMFLTGKILDFFVYDDTALYTRIMTHELYSMDKNIDVLCLGSSHCYRSLDPEIMDEEFGMCTFDAASPMQELDAASVIIRDALKRNEIKHIYLDMYYQVSEKVPYQKRDQLGFNAVIFDKLKPSVYKFRTMLGATSPENYPVLFIKSRRTTTSILNRNYVITLVKKKLTKEYFKYDPEMINNEHEKYGKKGFFYGIGTKKVGSFSYESHKNSISEGRISQDWKRSLLEIIEYCNKKGVAISLFSAPISDFELIDVGNYDKYIENVNSIIEGTGAEYRDFNLCRPEYFDSLGNNYFEDENHLNKSGAEAFSRLFCDYYNGRIPDEELFYDSYKEKLSELKYDVLGAVVKREKDEISIEPVTRTGSWEGIKCKVELQGSEGNRKLTVEPGEKIKTGDGETGDISVDLIYEDNEVGHIKMMY